MRISFDIFRFSFCILGGQLRVPKVGVNYLFDRNYSLLELCFRPISHCLLLHIITISQCPQQLAFTIVIHSTVGFLYYLFCTQQAMLLRCISPGVDGHAWTRPKTFRTQADSGAGGISNQYLYQSRTCREKH